MSKIRPGVVPQSLLLRRALRSWEDASAGLIEQGVKTARASESPRDEESIRQRVYQGLQIAWARYQAAVNSSDSFRAASVFGIFFDKWRLLRGEPTQITEERRWERLELLARIQKVLVEREAKPELPAQCEVVEIGEGSAAPEKAELA